MLYGIVNAFVLETTLGFGLVSFEDYHSSLFYSKSPNLI